MNKHKPVVPGDGLLRREGSVAGYSPLSGGTPVETFFLLKEDGDALLKEDSDHILKEDAL